MANIDLALSFNPAEASSAIARGELPASVRSFVFDKGTIGNASFLAIPYNAAHKEGALLLCDFLLSPEAQAKKQDPAGYGGFTVLAMGKLDAAERAGFEALPRGVATLSTEELGPVLPEAAPLLDDAHRDRLATPLRGAVERVNEVYFAVVEGHRAPWRTPWMTTVDRVAR